MNNTMQFSVPFKQKNAIEVRSVLIQGYTIHTVYKEVCYFVNAINTAHKNCKQERIISQIYEY